MPLPWTFAHQVLLPIDGGRTHRVPAHVRVFSDRWAGAWVVAGVLTGNGGERVAPLMPLIRAKLEGRLLGSAATWVSYQPEDLERFRSHRAPDDGVGENLPGFVVDQAPRDPSASGTRLLRCGPVVDVWDAADYTISSFRLKRPALAR